MVVCKFFQQGYCRFGQSCRFEHVYGSKYSYHAPQHASPAPAATTAPAATDEQLLKLVEADVQSVLSGSQWLLSSYAPFKDKPAIPGFIDLSFEEARLFIYEARANNNLEQAVAYINSIFKEAREKYEQLLRPTAAVVKTLRTINSNTQSGENASSVFRSAAQGFDQSNTASSIFGQKAQSVFGGDAAKSMFAQATESAFGSAASSNVFGPQKPAAQSIFAQAVQNQNTFSQNSNPVQNQSPFTQNSNPASVFAAASNQLFAPATQADPFAQRTDPFGQNSNSFGQNSDPFGQRSDPFNTSSNTDTSEVYSKIEDLSAEELESFRNTDFKLGFVPELPPPREMCI